MPGARVGPRINQSRLERNVIEARNRIPNATALQSKRRAIGGLAAAPKITSAQPRNETMSGAIFARRNGFPLCTRNRFSVVSPSIERGRCPDGLDHGVP
jgi:hypothetical protein